MDSPWLDLIVREGTLFVGGNFEGSGSSSAVQGSSELDQFEVAS